MFILASASPRRRELLTQIGCKFRVETSDAPEEHGSSLAPALIAVKNAEAKARAVASHWDIPVLRIPP